MPEKQSIIDKTFDRLRSLYEKNGFKPGRFLKAGLKQGWNALIGSEGQCGMAMSFSGFEAAFGRHPLDVPRLQSFIGSDLFDVASAYIQSKSWQERSIGVAAMVALSQPLVTPKSLAARGFDAAYGKTDFAGCLKPDDIVCVVGYGGGIKRLMGRCRELHVTDMRPRESFQTTLITDGSVEFVPSSIVVHTESANREVLSKATAVAITGSAIVNGSLDKLLGYVLKARFVTIYGGSAGFIPDVLFEHGVHMVHSSRISDPHAFERGMINDLNMEAVMQRTQTMQAIRTLKD
jgi:uncharacterized protein (DUF4213/DUF364 family)